MSELLFTLVHGPGQRRGAGVTGRRRKRDVAFSGEKAGGRVEADPARAREIDLRPGVQVGEIRRGPNRAIERLHIGRELNQVAGHEARRQTDMTQDLHEQPARVTAGAASPGECLVGCLNAGLEPDDVGDVLCQPAVEIDQEIDGADAAPIDGPQTIAEPRTRGEQFEVRRELLLQPRFVVERKRFGRRFEKEVERIEHRQLGGQVDVDEQLARLVGEHQSREMVAVGVLLPVDEVSRRHHLQ